MPPRARTVLYLPASNARAVEKARELDVDAVILDLEDAVAPEAKDAARQAAVEAARTGGFLGRLGVRVNALDTEWGETDLTAVADAPFAFVVVPKIERPDHVAAVSGRLTAKQALWLMIETPHALTWLDGIAATGGPLEALMLGLNDLALALRTGPSPDREPFKPWLSATVAAARANGLLAIDGVFNRLEDEEGLIAEARQGRLYGFDGKSLIHPKQINPVRVAFAPTEAEAAWARAVVAAFDDPANAGKGAVRAAGGMVERLHLDQARAILAEVA
ncbi:HpcH/HpaI aldolase/citrate lyase family protein [Brevundimonas balnearis]|uniref:HpcH/HpaI aldolase/citrate lyase family protein n=1 Tax=Brevundimonas balnearis TaxID=1572858 RepID=A0ABV6R5B9_9CAUL